MPIKARKGRPPKIVAHLEKDEKVIVEKILKSNVNQRVMSTQK